MVPDSREHATSDMDGDALPAAGALRRAYARFTRRRGDEPVDELGVPMRFHYWLLATFALGIGGFPLIISFTPAGAALAPPLVRVVCAVGAALAPLLIVTARAEGYRFDRRIFYGVLLYATAAPLISQQAMTGQQAPGQILFVAGPIGAALYLTLRQATPYILLAVAGVLTMGATIDQPEAVLRSWILSTLIVCGSLMVNAVRRQLVSTVALNRTLSECDALTGARNLRSFEQQLAEEVARAGRGGGEFALIEFDLDNFKQVNDLHNHSTGDRVLVATADAIGSAFDPADVLVRRGGDEFVVIAPGVANRDLESMVRLASERVTWMRHRVCPDVTPTVTSAIVVHRAGERAGDLFRRADEALHDAKQAAPGRRGQDAYVTEDEIPESPTPETPALKELQNRRIDGIEQGTDPIVGARRVIWKTTAAAILAIAVSIDLSTVLGLTTLHFSPISIALSLFSSVVFAPIVYRMSSRRSQPEYLLHMLGITAFVIITVGCVIAGKRAPALAESYMLAVLTILAILPARSAFFYMAVGMGLYTAVLLVHDYPSAGVQVVNTAIVVGLAGVILSVTRDRTIAAAHENAQLARTDALTGLPNKRRLTDRLADEIRRCKTTGGSLAMLMLDLDNFKLVNDLFSHAVGDEVLIAVADELSRTARHTDVPARRGGDEFAVILTDADARDATASRDRIATAIREARDRVCPDITPTATIGWVVWRKGESADQFLARADAALNLEKKAKRWEQRLVA